MTDDIEDRLNAAAAIMDREPVLPVEPGILIEAAAEIRRLRYKVEEQCNDIAALCRMIHDISGGREGFIKFVESKHD